jgi:nucleoside 2-deoxyribosyltransferase
MKVYIASDFGHRNDVLVLEAELERRGHEITCKWWMIDYKTSLKIESDDRWFSQPIIRTIYRRSLKAIEDADMLILVSPEQIKFNGANVEIGMALGLNKTVVCLGKLCRSAMYEPVIRCPTMDDLKNVLREFEER